MKRLVLAFDKLTVSPRAVFLLAVAALLLLGLAPAWSGGAGSLPWEDPLAKIRDSVTGPTARALGMIAVVALGVGFAFSEGGSLLRKALWVVLGVVIALGATNLINSFFGGSGVGSGLLV